MIERHDESKRDRDDGGRFAPGNRYGFRKGESGNPAGRTPGIVHISEHIASLITLTRGEVEAVLSDPLSPMARRIAARRILCADSDDREAGQDFARLTDRLEGRPRTTIDVRQDNIRRIVLDINGVTAQDILPPLLDDAEHNEP